MAYCWQLPGWTCWMKNKEENKMKYNTLGIIRQLMEHELVVAEQQIDLLNEELKRVDPDGVLPETDARVRVRKAAKDRRYEMECALKDFDAQDWQ